MHNIVSFGLILTFEGSNCSGRKINGGQFYHTFDQYKKRIGVCFITYID